jgi:hypothetical protein
MWKNETYKVDLKQTIEVLLTKKEAKTSPLKVRSNLIIFRNSPTKVRCVKKHEAKMR